MDTTSNPSSPLAAPPRRVDAAAGDRRGGTWRARLRRWAPQVGRDTVHVLASFALGVASFSALVSGVAVSVGLIPLALVGVAVGVLVLFIGDAFAAAQRALVRFSGEPIDSPRYRPVDAGQPLWRRLLARYRDPQHWLNLAHGLVIFPVSLATFVVVTVWWSVMLGGLTYPIWEPLFLDPPRPDENRTIVEALDWSFPPPLVTQFLMGVVALLTIVPVVRGCAVVHAAIARGLLANPYIGSLHDRVDSLTASRTAIAEAEVRSLRQLERDLHDGPQQRLVRLGMDLAAAERRLETDPDESRRLVAEARAMTAEALEELRQLSRGIAPPVLTDRGLAAAIDALGARSTIPVRIDVHLGGRPAVAIETAAYFVISEALANAAKHSRAELITVSVNDTADSLDVVVTDNGVGGASIAKGHGLAGLAERVRSLDGEFDVISPSGGPTTVRARLPR